jgi:hypothetical protein
MRQQHCPSQPASISHGSGSGSGILLPNGCLQQIAANRFSMPQDVIAILLQGFVLPSWATGLPHFRHLGSDEADFCVCNVDD